MLIALHVGQIWNQCWWRHLVVKFWTNTSGTAYNWPNLEPMQVAFYLAGEITQVKESIPWVRCASGNVFEAVHKKLNLGPKQHFWAQKRQFWAIGPWNGPKSGQTAIYWKTEGVQSYLRIWGTYDPIDLDPSDMGEALKNADFRAKNATKKIQTLSKNCVTIMTGHLKDNIFVLIPLHGGPRGGPRGQFLAQKSAFFYATPI